MPEQQRLMQIDETNHFEAILANRLPKERNELFGTLRQIIAQDTTNVLEIENTLNFSNQQAQAGSTPNPSSEPATEQEIQEFLLLLQQIYLKLAQAQQNDPSLANNKAFNQLKSTFDRAFLAYMAQHLSIVQAPLPANAKVKPAKMDNKPKIDPQNSTQDRETSKEDPINAKAELPVEPNDGKVPTGLPVNSNDPDDTPMGLPVEPEAKNLEGSQPKNKIPVVQGQLVEQIGPDGKITILTGNAEDVIGDRVGVADTVPAGEPVVKGVPVGQPVVEGAVAVDHARSGLPRPTALTGNADPNLSRKADTAAADKQAQSSDAAPSPAPSPSGGP